MREAAEHRLFGEWRLRRIRRGRSGLCRASARQRRFRRDRADPVRRRDGLQGPQGHGHQARRLGRDLRHRRPRPSWPCSTPRRWASTSSRSTSTTPSSISPRSWARRSRVNARKADPAAFVKKEVGGAQGVLVTAVSPKAFEQAIGMVGRGGTVSLNGLPPGSFPLSIFDTVLNGITVRGSIVGTRLDLQEALRLCRRRQGQGDDCDRTGSRTSTRSSPACMRATFKAASSSILKNRDCFLGADS